MKRFALFLMALSCLFCLFAISAFAQDAAPEVTDRFYVVASQDSEAALALKAQGESVIVLSEVYASTTATSGSDWIDSFAEGSHIELIFAENIVESVSEFSGILLAKPITLTVRYNGFVHLITNYVSKENMFVLRHSGAKINFFGTSQIYDENGNAITDFTYNSNDLTQNKVQIRHSKVYCWVYDGDVYAENIRSSTGQEFVYVDSDNSSADPSVVNTYEFVDCALRSDTDPIALFGKDSAPKIVKISGGYYSSISLHTVCSGSYINNCQIGGKLYMDCWGITNQMLVLENTVIGGSVSTSTGRTHIKFIDCTFDISKLSLGSDGGGKCYALVYTSATCEADGTLNVYVNGAGTTPVNGKDVNNDSMYAQTVADFYADPQSYALGHNIRWSYDFAGDKYMSALTATNCCSRCGDVVEAVSVDTLFTTLGYSVPTFGTALSISVGFSINKTAISQYEALTGSKINFGCVVAAKDNLGENNAPLDENGDAVVLPQGQIIKADITDEAFEQISLKVVLTDALKDKALLMSGFIIETNEEGTSVSYMQDRNSLVSDNLFEYVSYSSFNN